MKYKVGDRVQTAAGEGTIVKARGRVGFDRQEVYVVELSPHLTIELPAVYLQPVPKRKAKAS